jgi:glycosyltransferase involved in cell wall biosynthesis
VKDDGYVLRLYQQMGHAESKRMLQLINDLGHVRAWYSPTAFWPAFNEIRAPRLMCVPDVVLTSFPVGFSSLGGDRTLATYEAVEAAIRSSENFVTYSEAVKWNTLVDRFAVRAADVAVIYHAPNDLSRWVSVSGFTDNEATSRHHCETLLTRCLQRSSGDYSRHFDNASVKYIFYASQFRPNKNLASLLRAYEYLLRKKFITHKLVLTGSPEILSVGQSTLDKSIQNDVLFLHGLDTQELAACYKLADLAINPSLSEGGCPFTFTEALSVDTPVVMARIPVTEEVLTDAKLQDATFFDPYDWMDIAHRIEWALHHRDDLLALQRRTYTELSQRKWIDVVNEHVDVLDRISDAKAS